MNGKRAKIIRKIARLRARSHNETSTKSIVTRKIEGVQFAVNYNALINYQDNIFMQRKLDQFSLKRICKKIKLILKNISHIQQPIVLSNLFNNPDPVCS